MANTIEKPVTASTNCAVYLTLLWVANHEANMWKAEKSTQKLKNDFSFSKNYVIYETKNFENQFLSEEWREVRRCLYCLKASRREKILNVKFEKMMNKFQHSDLSGYRSFQNNRCNTFDGRNKFFKSGGTTLIHLQKLFFKSLNNQKINKLSCSFPGEIFHR